MQTYREHGFKKPRQHRCRPVILVPKDKRDLLVLLQVPVYVVNPLFALNFNTVLHCGCHIGDGRFETRPVTRDEGVRSVLQAVRGLTLSRIIWSPSMQEEMQ